MGPMKRRGWWGVGLAALVLAGCGTPAFRVVSNGKEHTYAKVPRDWAVIPIETGRVDRLDPAFGEDVELIWSVGLDAAASPDAGHFQQLVNYEPLDEPTGVLSVYQIQGSYAQKVSLTEARMVPLAVDPLFVGDEVKDLVEIVDYQPFAPSDGLQGSRVVFNMRPQPDAPWSTYDLVTSFDQSRARMYTLVVGCSGECFKANRHTISQLVSSWKVDR